MKMLIWHFQNFITKNKNKLKNTFIVLKNRKMFLKIHYIV